MGLKGLQKLLRSHISFHNTPLYSLHFTDIFCLVNIHTPSFIPHIYFRYKNLSKLTCINASACGGGCSLSAASLSNSSSCSSCLQDALADTYAEANMKLPRTTAVTTTVAATILAIWTEELFGLW